MQALRTAVRTAWKLENSAGVKIHVRKKRNEIVRVEPKEVVLQKSAWKKNPRTVRVT